MGERFAEGVAPPLGVDGSGFAGVDHPDAEGRIGIVEADGKKFVVAIVNDGELTGLAGTVLIADAFVKDPGVAGADDGFGGGAEADAKARLRRCWSRIQTAIDCRE